MPVALHDGMLRPFTHAVALGALAALMCLLGAASCAHPATDRVLEPSGAADASSSSPGSPLADAAAVPIGPIATAVEPAPDFHAIRAPEFGEPMPAAGGNFGSGGSPGMGGAPGMGGTGGRISR